MWTSVHESGTGTGSAARRSAADQKIMLQGKRVLMRWGAGFVTSGFYELLYDGGIKVLSKFEKKFMETASGLDLQREFEERTRWYVSIQGKYFMIKNKKSVYSLFREHRAELKKFIREANLSFKNTMENDLILLAGFCEKFL